MDWRFQIRSARMTPSQFSEFSDGYVAEAQRRGHEVGEISRYEDRQTDFPALQVVPMSDRFGAHWVHDFRLVVPREAQLLQSEARYKCIFLTRAPNGAVTEREAEGIKNALRGYLSKTGD